MSTKLKIQALERKITSVERFFTHSPFSIVTMVARIKGNVSADILKNAVFKVLPRHAFLSVRIRDDLEHGLWFTSEDVQEIPIEIVPRSSEDDWIEVHTDASRIPFQFEVRPAVRFILVQSPEVSELIILCHHIICDGMSLAYLARDLLVHLGNPARQIDLLPAPPPIDRDNLPRDVSQSFLAKLLIKRMNRKWADESVHFNQEDYEAITHAYWDHFDHKLFSIELPESETSALVARCRKENVTVNSALAAAFSGAQSIVEGKRPDQAKVVVAASLRDRIPNPPGEGMGMYAGGVELKFRYDHEAGFWENARRFHQGIRPKYTNQNLFSDLLNWLYLDPSIFEAMNFKKLGGLVSPDSPRYEKLADFSQKEDVVFRILKRDNLESLETRYWGTAVTNLGRLDFPRRYGELELDRLIMQPGGGIPLVNVSLVLGAITCSGKLSLVVEYAEQAVHTQKMEEIKEKALDFISS